MIIFRICKCGHTENKHVYLDQVIPNASHIGLCGDCKPLLDNPHKFTLDNLKYLEQLYDNRKRT